MLGTVSGWLRKASTGRVALAALVIFLLFTALVLPQQAGQAEQQTGQTESPDTSLFYSPQALYRMAEAYGEEGRRAYVRARFTFDLVWPLVYTFFLVTTTGWAFRRGFPPDSRWQRTNLVPLLAALFDYLENVSTSFVMLRYPAQTPVVDLLAPVFTLFKWGLLGAAFLLLSIGMVAVIWQSVRGKGRSEQGR
jgi:hypothetical protein